MNILGIESSCDDAGIALINQKQIIENIVTAQFHKSGVIPEYAARMHYESVYKSLKNVVQNYKIDLIAYTNGPGLIGSLFVGSSFAKSLAYSLNCEIMAVHHIHGHMLLPVWLYDITFPALCLTVSGGHTMIVMMHDIDSYEIVSTTIDDAAGEVFDKVARYLGFDYPGGVHIDKAAEKAFKHNTYKFPWVMDHSLNFSFSGLKTAAINIINNKMKIDFAKQEDKANFCFDFQKHIAKIFKKKLDLIFKKYPYIKNFIVTGGVAANSALKSELQNFGSENALNIYFPPLNLCSDNGVMIAAAAFLKYQKYNKKFYDLNVRPDANYPLIFNK